MGDRPQQNRSDLVPSTQKPQHAPRHKTSETSGSSYEGIKVASSGRGEYIARELWQVTLTSGDESLSLGIVQMGTGIVFSDTDSDGVFETYVQLSESMALGGRFWKMTFDFDTRVVRLAPTNKTPIAAGYKAPAAKGTLLDSDKPIDLVTKGSTSVLVFCFAGCRGCQVIAGSLKTVFDRYKANDAIRLINVARNTEEARGCRKSICPGFTQAIAPDAWKAYGVTPTPTIVVVDGAGIINYRGTGTGSRTADLLIKVLDDIR